MSLDQGNGSAAVIKGGPRKMPAQKPGRSEQTVATPFAFIDAVEKRFRRLTFDLAATIDNCRVRFPDVGRSMSRSYFGPASPVGEDSLAQLWARLRGNLFLNPPYGDIKTWARKCHETPRAAGRRILFLVPASVGSNWWLDYVHDKALVLFTSPRVTFETHSAPYPKDLALVVFSASDKPGYECWRWDGKEKPV